MNLPLIYLFFCIFIIALTVKFVQCYFLIFYKFFPAHVDCGDHVIIINCDKAVLTGKKLEQKNFYWHTGWIGGLKAKSYKELMANEADKAMTIAVNGMIPNTSQGRDQMKRLRTYKGTEHKHEAQKPEVLTF
mgnify:CR=1 FL=1